MLPAEERAKIGFRLVPDQDPADLLPKLRRHFDAHGFSDVQITQFGGKHPVRIPPDKSGRRSGHQKRREPL